MLVRRRIAPTIPDATTLALERGPVEPESHHLPLSPGLLMPEGNVLSVEVHPRAIERCPRIDLELLLSDGPRVVRGPYIERLFGGVLDLALQTNTPTYFSVRYGKGEHNRLFRERHNLHRLALHARSLRLEHPVSGAPLLLTAAVPADLVGALAGLGAPASLLLDVLDDMS